MAENKIAVIVGIPGVGKTTVISQVEQILKSKNHNVEVVVFGSIMFEEARKKGLQSRDEMRRLSIEEQRNLQELAAQRIAERSSSIVIVDTHLFINTLEGYYPGLPMRLLNILKPTNMILIIADAEEIVKRRKSDSTRMRDNLSTSDIQNELDNSKMMISASAVITGSPFTIVNNDDDKVEITAMRIVQLLTGEGT